MIIKYNPTKETILSCIYSNENPKGFDIVKNPEGQHGYDHLVRLYDEEERMFSEFEIYYKPEDLNIRQIEKLYHIATCSICWDGYCMFLSDFLDRIPMMPRHNGSSVVKAALSPVVVKIVIVHMLLVSKEYGWKNLKLDNTTTMRLLNSTTKPKVGSVLFSQCWKIGLTL